MLVALYSHFVTLNTFYIVVFVLHGITLVMHDSDQQLLWNNDMVIDFMVKNTSYLEQPYFFSFKVQLETKFPLNVFNIRTYSHKKQ